MSGFEVVGASETAGDETQVLADPGLPEGDLTQTSYQFFQLCGLALLTYGPGSVSECYSALSNVAPAFSRTQANQVGIGVIAGQQHSCWFGFQGSQGSAIAYFCLEGTDLDFVTENVTMPLNKLPQPWEFGIGTVGANVPTQVARVLRGAHAVPIWEIEGLEHADPAVVTGAALPRPLRRELEAFDPQHLDGGMFSITLSTNGNRSQLIYIGPEDREHFVLMSPVGTIAEGSIPEQLLGRDFGDYELQAFGDTLALTKLLSVGPPTPTLETLRPYLKPLADLADQIEAELSTEDRF